MKYSVGKQFLKEEYMRKDYFSNRTFHLYTVDEK